MSEQQGDRPAWLPAKFKNPEELARSYTELEKKLGSPAAAAERKAKAAPSVEADELAERVSNEAQSPEEESDDGMIPEIDLEAITGEPSKPEVDPEKDRQEVSDVINKGLTGPLDAEALARLEKAGISREVIEQIQNRMAEGEQAKAQLQLQEYTKGIGGLEKWNEVREWAATALSKEDQDGLNDIFASNKHGAIRAAIENLHHKYRRAQGPQFITGSRGSDTPDTFAGQDQVVTAMKDPRYKTDAAYRKSIEDRALRSDFSRNR